MSGRDYRCPKCGQVYRDIPPPSQGYVLVCYNELPDESIALEPYHDMTVDRPKPTFREMLEQSFPPPGSYDFGISREEWTRAIDYWSAYLKQFEKAGAAGLDPERLEPEIEKTRTVESEFRLEITQDLGFSLREWEELLEMFRETPEFVIKELRASLIRRYARRYFQERERGNGAPH